MMYETDKIKFISFIKNECLELSVNLIKNLGLIQYKFYNQVIFTQLIKSSTSVGANYNAACIARSRKEFYSKMSIVIEETDETIYWLNILSEIYPEQEKVWADCKERYFNLLKIFSKARKTLSN